MKEKNKDLKNIKVAPIDHKKFTILCVKHDLNQDEMFHLLLEKFR